MVQFPHIISPPGISMGIRAPGRSLHVLHISSVISLEREPPVASSSISGYSCWWSHRWTFKNVKDKSGIHNFFFFGRILTFFSDWTEAHHIHLYITWLFSAFLFSLAPVSGAKRKSSQAFLKRVILRHKERCWHESGYVSYKIKGPEGEKQRKWANSYQWPLRRRPECVPVSSSPHSGRFQHIGGIFISKLRHLEFEQEDAQYRNYGLFWFLG